MTKKIFTFHCLPNVVPFSTVLTAFSMTMMPSPRMMSESNPMRSTRCVLLKLTTFQTDEEMITATTSARIMKYHEM